MEAATPLFAGGPGEVHVLGDTVVVEHLSLQDARAARVLEDSDDALGTLRDVVEIGARIVERQQTGADAELVKAEIEQAGQRFGEHATRLAERMDEKVAAVFA